MLVLSVANYSDEEITALISCRKNVSEPPKREMKLVNADFRNDAKFTSEGTPGEFLVFVRQSEDFPENFSIGLTYQPNDGRGDVTLLRCNGPHGCYNGKLNDPQHPHWGYHVHRATEEAMEAGMRAERNAEKVDDYASLPEALQYFLIAVNLDPVEATKHFPGASKQSMLF